LLVATDVHFQVLVNDGFHSAAAVVGPVVVATEPQIEAPLALDLGFVVVEDTAVGELPIRNSGKGWLEIQEVTIDNPSFELLAIPDPFRVLVGTVVTIGVRYVPTAVGSEAAVMTIRSNAVTQPELTVNLKGDGVDAETPTISVPRRTLDLGQVSPGGRATASLVVTNTSQVPLTVEPAVTGGGYTLETPGPLVLTPGEQHATVIVAFSNATAGAFVGTLTLASNDPNQPSLDIALVVAVVEPPNVDDAIGPRPSSHG